MAPCEPRAADALLLLFHGARSVARDVAPRVAAAEASEERVLGPAVGMLPAAEPKRDSEGVSNVVEVGARGTPGRSSGRCGALLPWRGSLHPHTAGERR